MTYLKRTSNRLAQHPWVIAAFIIWAAAALHILHGIPITHIRGDEALSFINTRPDLFTFLERLFFWNNHPPLWYTNFWFWQRFAGDTEFSGRMESILFSMMTLAFVYRLGWRWFGQARHGLFAMAVLGVNAVFFIYSLEMRPYAMNMLAASVNMWFFTRWLDTNRPRMAVFYGLSAALLLYIHYYLVFLIIAQVIYFMLIERPRWAVWKQGLIAGAAAIIAWLPWVPVMFAQFEYIRWRAENKGISEIGLATTTYDTSLPVINELINTASNGLPWLYGGLLLLGLVVYWRRRRYAIALLWGLAVPAMVLAVNIYANVYTHRYVSFMILGVGLAAGAALASLPRYWRVLALLAVMGVSLFTMGPQLPVRTPVRDLLQEVSARANRETDIVFFDAGTDRSFQALRYLDSDLYDNHVQTVVAAQPYRRIWYVTDKWFEDGARDNFNTLTETHSLLDVIGECREWCYLVQLMVSPPSQDAMLYRDMVGLLGLDVLEQREDGLDLRLWWRSEQTPDADYSVGIYLMDEDRVILSQTDGPINDFYDGETQMTAIEPDRTYLDERTLPIPADLAPGEYHIGVSVYQWWDSERLLLEGGDDVWLAEQTISVD